MQLSRKWLNEYTSVTVDDRAFAEAMTLSGSKVEITEDLSATMHGIVVGKVLSVTRHENSDHMWVCSIDIGGEAPLQIVTGAQNVQAGDLVPVATDGSLLPDGKEIHTGELRGVKSEGMLCSLKELGLTLHDYPYAAEDGIWILQEGELSLGMDIRTLIGADDHVVEFEITPNRPDCLSVIGLAREAAATFGGELTLHTPVVKGSGGNIHDHASVVVADGTLCPRYTARLVKNVKIAPSPAWMRERLRNSGVRPINNIVDITNYVMLEYGQPMHAFDFSCVEGGKIVVRLAKEGEGITTLDGNTRAITPDMLCICDEHKPVCVAGVMGGANSEIVGDTAMVLFESANFDGTSVRRTALALNMRTDASARYEKGLDPANTVAAVERACELVEMLGCGEVVDGMIDVISAPMEERHLKLEVKPINELLGTNIPESEMRKILKPLGFVLNGDDILVPSWRSDVEGTADIAEEVARFYGYNAIPDTLYGGGSTVGGYSKETLFQREAGGLCRSLGYDEIITYSFASPSMYDKLRLCPQSEIRNSLKILNPLGEDRSIMRRVALASLLEILCINYNKGNRDVRLYECAKVYHPRDNGLANEEMHLTMGLYGEGESFFTLKGDVETLCRSLRIRNVRYEAERNNPSFHPGRCAKLWVGEDCLGTIGQIHPQVAANFGADTELYAVELNLPLLLAHRAGDPIYAPLPRFPAISRDLALLCHSETTVGQLMDCIKGNGGRILRDVRLFDIYTGKGIAEGKKSVAFSLTLRSDEGSLTAEDAEKTVKNILDALQSQLDAHLR